MFCGPGSEKKNRRTGGGEKRQEATLGALPKHVRVAMNRNLPKKANVEQWSGPKTNMGRGGGIQWEALGEDGNSSVKSWGVIGIRRLGNQLKSVGGEGKPEKPINQKQLQKCGLGTRKCAFEEKKHSSQEKTKIAVWGGPRKGRDGMVGIFRQSAAGLYQTMRWWLCESKQQGKVRKGGD